MTISDGLWLLIGLQMAMGVTDTLLHHEFTERLAWRASAGRELRLHAVRNWFYSVVFAILGFASPGGWIALALLAVLVIEVGITLWDFVEEDLSRRLPASERVLHTLLALNYGGILVLLVPELWTAVSAPTSLAPAWHGVGSVLCAIATMGTAAFGCRDWLASKRTAGFPDTPAHGLTDVLAPRRHVLVTGATGFIGRRLVAGLIANGHRVTALVRGGQSRAGLPMPITLVGSLEEISADARIDAIVNLAGAPIAERPWTRRNRLRMLRSRLATTRSLGRLIARLDHKPDVLLSGSAVGWYGHESDMLVDEGAPQGRGFASRLCAAWEDEADRIAATSGVRVVKLRLGVVLGREGGMLAGLLPAFDLGLGGPIGSGRQWLSWISRDDAVRLIAFAVATPALRGSLNATAPEPATNREFAHTLARTLGRPAVLAVPALPLRVVLGDLAEEILLASQRVVPAKALAAGFVFRHPRLETALEVELGGKRSQRARGELVMGRARAASQAST